MTFMKKNSLNVTYFLFDFNVILEDNRQIFPSKWLKIKLRGMKLITIQVMYTRLQGRSCNLHIFNKIVGRYQAKIHENLPENGIKFNLKS